LSARILVIDDEANIRMMIRLALEHSGYTVDTAGDGEEGLVKFGDGRLWDLVLLDQRMPGLSGLEVQRGIYERNPDAKLIMITAFGTIDLALEAIQAGASDFLRKPFTTETLRTAVRTALERPVQRMHPVPAGMAGREFTRTTINGFSFDLDETATDCFREESSPDLEFVFRVRKGIESPDECHVLLPAYVMELTRAYADSETMPGGLQFWQAMCEEALANYLWQHAELPPNSVLRIEDLSSSLQRWLDAVLTVEMTEENASTNQ
jgi:DNA-binding response OmpR family regulator